MELSAPIFQRLFSYLFHKNPQAAMKYPSVAFISVVLVSFLALSQSGEIGDVPHQFDNYSIIDPIIKAVLESLKPKLANIQIPDVNQTVRNPNLNATVIVNGILIKNADAFVIQNLKSNVVPLKLTNLTLTWKDITAKASYNIDVSISNSQQSSPFRLFAKGEAGAILKDLYFTIGANIEMKNNGIQIKPKGLFGFDLRIGSTNVTVSSLMGSAEFGNAVGSLLSRIIPDAVDSLKKPIFDAFQDDIIRVVNDVLKKNGTKVSEETEDLFEIADDLSSDLSLEFARSLFQRSKALKIDFEEDESDFNF